MTPKRIVRPPNIVDTPEGRLMQTEDGWVNLSRARRQERRPYTDDAPCRPRYNRPWPCVIDYAFFIGEPREGKTGTPFGRESHTRLCLALSIDDAEMREKGKVKQFVIQLKDKKYIHALWTEHFATVPADLEGANLIVTFDPARDAFRQEVEVEIVPREQTDSTHASGPPVRKLMVATVTGG